MVYREFMLELERLGYSVSGRKQIGAAVREFLDWWNSSKITQKTIEAYYQYLSQRPHKYQGGGLSSKTIAGHLYALRLYLSYLEEEGYLASHPMSGLRFARPQSESRAILTKAEVARLYQGAETLKRREALRAKAVLAVFYGCGLRRKEGEDLNLVDVQLRSGMLYVRKGKGSKRRVIPMSERVKTDMKNYLREGRGQSPAELNALFINHRGRRMRGPSFDRLLKKLLQIAKIGKPISLHCLRHSIATHLLSEGVPLESVRDFLGHAHLETTQIYTRVEERSQKGEER